MARLPERNYTYFQTVRGMCSVCSQIVPARVFFQNEQVWQESLCSECKNRPVLIAGDKNWYLENVLKAFPDHSPLRGSKPPRKGCPHDCGPCTWHASPPETILVPLSLPVQELQKTVQWLDEFSNPFPSINLLIRKQIPGDDFCDAIAVAKTIKCKLGILLIPDCVDGIETILENILSFGLQTTLICESTQTIDVNLLLGLLQKYSLLCNITWQTAMPVDLVARQVCEQSQGKLKSGDFSVYSSGHSLCRMVCPITASKTISVHSIMDRARFDCSRAMLCPEMVATGPSKLTPACIYEMSMEREGVK